MKLKNRIGTRANHATGGRTTFPVLSLLLAVILLSTVANALPAQAATGNETPATATDLGNWDTITTGTRTNQTLRHSSDSINYYKFTLTGEREVYIHVKNQDVSNATLKITDDGGNMIFDQNRTGTRGQGSNLTYYDGLDWQVIGPGTWYIKIEQRSTTLNRFDLVWDVQDRVALPDDDFYGGVWTDGGFAIDHWTDGEIRSANSSDRGKDLDWLKFDLEDAGKYEIRVIGRNSRSKPLMLLYDRYGQFIKFGHGGRIFYNTRDGSSGTGVHFVELRGRDTDYRVGVRTGHTPYGSEPFMRDLPASTRTKGFVRPGRNAVWGRILHEHDYDDFRVRLTKGRDYRIQMRGRTATASLSDPIIVLGGSYGQFLAPPTDLVTLLLGDDTQFIGDDDSGPGRDSLLDVRINWTGTYYVKAEGAGDSTGEYEIEVDEIPGSVSEPSDGDLPNSNDTRGRLKVYDGSVTGQLLPNEDQTEYDEGEGDAYRVELFAGQRYVFRVVMDERVGPNMFRSRLNLYDSSYEEMKDNTIVEQVGVGFQHVIGIVDTGSGNGAAEFTVDAHVTGIYYLRVSRRPQNDMEPHNTSFTYTATAAASRQ